MRKVLVVEDDKDTNEVICEFLKAAGFEVITAFDGNSAAEVFYDSKVDIAVLDIMLPGQSGLEVLKYIRSLSQIPVIMLTALGDEYTQLKSFDLSADEYVTKPFSPMVLVKRVEALLRRADPMENTVLTLGDVVVDFSSYTVTRKEEKLDFTTREIDLLKYLAAHSGQAVSRQQILDEVWGLDSLSSDRTVDTHIKNIRKKLVVPCISTVKNVGYRFEVMGQ